MPTVKIGEETIHLHKGFLGWRVVKPIKNDDGSYNWNNLIAGGNWFNLFFLAVLVAIIVGSIFEYVTAVRVANDCLAQSPLYGLLN